MCKLDLEYDMNAKDADWSLLSYSWYGHVLVDSDRIL